MYCYIFEYSSGTINKIELSDDDKELEGEEVLIKYGFNPDNCAWMFSNILYIIM